MPALDFGIAKFVRPGETESGDCHLVCTHEDGTLLAVMDGIGHGVEAANASHIASSVLQANIDEPIISLVQLCHKSLLKTRGVVLSLAFVDPVHSMMTWLGVGNVQGMLMRAGAKKGVVQETLLLRGGVVGGQLPPLQATVLPIYGGDTLVFATDGVRDTFVESLSPLEGPQHAADRLLRVYHHGNDDALVFMARYNGAHP